MTKYGALDYDMLKRALLCRFELQGISDVKASYRKTDQARKSENVDRKEKKNKEDRYVPTVNINVSSVINLVIIRQRANLSNKVIKFFGC
jgi:hypothetical protein